MLEKATNLTNGMRVALCRAIEEHEGEAQNSEVLFSIEVDTPGDDR